MTTKDKFGRGSRKSAKEFIDEAHSEPDDKLDKEVSKEFNKNTRIQRIALFAEGLMLNNGNKSQAILHCGLALDSTPTNRAIVASQFYSKNKRKIQSFLRNEFNNQMLSQVGNAMKTVAGIMMKEDARDSDRMKAAELVVKWSNV